LTKKIIISKGRANNVLTLETLGFLKGFSIFLTHPEDEDAYSVLDVPIYKAAKPCKNIAEGRNRILDLYEAEKQLWIMDDDIYDIYIRKKLSENGKWWHLESIKKNKKKILRAFNLIEKNFIVNDFALAGFSFRQTNWQTTKPFLLNKASNCLTLHNMHAVKEIGKYDENMFIMEDIELTVRAIKKGYTTFLDYQHAFGSPNMSSTPGGLYDFYRNEGSKLSKTTTDYFMKKHGSEYIKPIQKKAHKQFGLTEATIRWKKLVKDYQGKEKDVNIHTLPMPIEHCGAVEKKVGEKKEKEVFDPWKL